MTTRRTWFIPTLFSILLIAYYVFLAWVVDRGPNANERQILRLNLGAETTSRSGSLATDHGDLVFNADRSTGEATWDDHPWDYFSYEIGHLISRSRQCELQVALVGTNLSSPDPNGAADILFNHEVIKHITFSKLRRGLFPFAGNRFVPANIVPVALELVPLDREYGFLVPVPQRFCSAKSVAIGVRLTDASWTLTHAGIAVRYTPTPQTPYGRIGLLVAGASVLAALIGFCLILVNRFWALGPQPLLAAVVTLAAAPLTFDQWDFRIWLSFGELTAFGGGYPAYMWYGSPLWTFVPSLFSTVTAAAYVASGYGSGPLTALLVKIGMGLAYSFTALSIIKRAPIRLRTLYATVALLSPVGLYELAGGYREIFSGLLAVWCLVYASRKRLAVSTIFAIAAASISEELLPLMLLPATLALTTRAPLGRRILVASLLAVGGIAAFMLEWQIITPHEVAIGSLGYRFGAAPLGGASWSGALDLLGALPDWLPARAPLFNVILFVVLCAGPGFRIYGIIDRRNEADESSAFEGIVTVFVAFVAAFLVAFRGTDPNLWYSLSTLTLWSFASGSPRNPFPLLLATVEGLAFYCTVGFREYVNQALFWPVGKGLLGVLSMSRSVFDLMVNALMVALIVAISRRNMHGLISTQTSTFIALFFAAVAATATAAYLLDILICSVVVANILHAVQRSIASDRQYDAMHVSPLFQAIAIATLTAAGAFAASHRPIAGACATAACLLAMRGRIGSCDVVFGIGTIAILAVQPGSGVVSDAGWIAVTATLVAILASVVKLRPYSTPA